MREIALDTETTGLDPEKGHRLVELGCVEMHGRVRTGKFFHTYLNPERDVPDEVVRIHGLTTKFLSDKPVFASVVEDFLEFVGDAPLVIHNASFDLKFINAELKMLGFKPIHDLCTVTDTLEMARKKFPGAQNNLDALCKRFNVDASARTHHGALLDAELLADVYLELTGGRQSMLELLAASEEAATVSPDGETPETSVLTLSHRTFALTAEETERHHAMLRKLKNPIWAEA